MRALTQVEFLERAIRANGSYDYSQAEYRGARQKVVVVCREHGPFSVFPGALFHGVGCARCWEKRRSSCQRWPHSRFLEAAKTRWGAAYDYSRVEYRGARRKVTIVCPKHGEFQQEPMNHLNGHGCPECGNERNAARLKDSPEDFLRKCRAAHGELYDYSRVAYTDSFTDVEVVCRKHGSFWSRPNDHVKGVGCPSCTTNHSAPHKEIEAYLGTLGIEYVSNTRSIIPPKELDIYVPSHRLAIEFNGMYWHAFGPGDPASEKYRHREKYETCRRAGILLLQIDEHEWMNETTRSVWMSVLASKLGKHRRVAARATEFRPISRHEANRFLSTNHLQGGTPVVRWAFGLFHGDHLVGVITFAMHEKGMINLTRLAFPLGVTVIGGARKLFQNALPHLPEMDIVTFSNNQYSDGSVYGVLGFEKEADLPPSYQWLFRGSVWNKRQMRRRHLARRPDIQFDPSKTEHQNLFAAGARCLYDAGYRRWRYRQLPASV